MRRLMLTAVVTAMSFAGWALPAAAGTYTQTADIAIPSSGNAAPFPSQVVVDGDAGPVTDVNVTLNGITHVWAEDMDIMLVGPAGQAVMLLSDACGADDLVSVTIDQQAPSAYGATTGCPSSGTTQPVDHLPGEAIGPIPGDGYGTDLSVFDGTNPRGTWSLYVVDDLGGFSGVIGDWTLTLTTGSTEIAVPAGAPTSSGPGTPYPSTHEESGWTGTITDLNVRLDGVSHSYPDDLDLVLVGPDGTNVMLVSDACLSTDLNQVDFRVDDAAAAVFPDGAACFSGTFTPSDYGVPEDLPAPAPVGPYGTTLSAFNGKSPNGQWKLYAADDSGPDAGFITGWRLEITTTDGTALSGAAPGAPNPLNREVGGLTRPVADVDVELDKVWSTNPDNLELLLVSPSGRAVRLMSDVCGGTDVSGRTFTIDDEAPAEFASSGPCPSGAYRPTQGAATPTFAAPAPAPPYDTTLAAFDGQDGNGTWRLYAQGDGTQESGLTYRLKITEQPAPPPAPSGTGTPAPTTPTASKAFSAASAFGLPSNKACVRRGGKLRLAYKRPKGVTVGKVEVLIGGKRVLQRTGSRARTTLTLSKLPRKAFTVTLKVTPTGGKTATIKRTYKVCAAKR